LLLILELHRMWHTIISASITGLSIISSITISCTPCLSRKTLKTWYRFALIMEVCCD